MKRFLASTAIVTMALMTASFVATPAAQAAEDVVMTTTAAPLTQFTPQPSKNTQIGYRAWSELLGDIILFMGPSTRQNWKAPERELGSRISRTHNSPYRMEGNKVLYPYMRGNIKTAIEEYVVELEGIGNRIDIPAMPRNEQLAYWINLHNALVINIVAENYPGPQRKPENIKPVEGSDLTLHDAKVITIDGVPLSLRDIREAIVYPNWSSPDVPLAFYLGDASSPSLSNVAYLPSELGTQLKANAEEYVNSLRGIDDGKVSRVFHDVAPWYFPDFNADIDGYFQSRMRAEVFREYSNKGYRGVNRYDNIVNDITAGWGERGRQRLSVSSDIDGFAFGKEVQQFFVDRAEKIERLRKEPWFKRGTVTIIDIETEDTGEVK
jgi:hypothetical protein